jgi:glycosyltransferase involved in cell wall biosynthesis
VTASCDPADRTTLWLFITALCVGGAERTLVDLANELDGDRYEVTVWTIFATNPLASELRADVEVRALTDAGRFENGAVAGVHNPLAVLTAPVRFAYAAAVERPDVVQSFLLWDNVIARLAGIVSDATIVTGVRAVPEDPGRGRALLDRGTIRLSDVVVSNSRSGADLAVARGADPECVRVIRNGRDLSEYRSADADAVEAELGIEGEPVVGTVGRLIERKGHYELLTAWATVREHVPDARLVVAGDGEERAALQEHARDCGCADSVEFLGTRRDVPALLSAMDVFVLPSHFEGLPGAVIEAMAAGLPIVATPVDGTAELLDGYRTGLFVPARDPAPLAWATIRLLQSADLRVRLGDDAQARAEAAFAVETMVDEFESLYADVGHSGDGDPRRQTSPDATAARSG